MRSLIIIDSLNDGFWQIYSDLWQNSFYKSPFQSPAVLQYFSRLHNNEAIAIQLLKDDKLIGAVILKKEKAVYTFLSDKKTDANFFTFQKDCDEDDVAFFFTAFLDKIHKLNWAVKLNNVPSWAGYMQIFETCGLTSKLFWQKIKYSVCPVIKADTTEELLKIVNRSPKFRYTYNRLSNQLQAEYEILTDDRDLENWVQSYCNSHTRRWDKTPTPSSYRYKANQQFLLDCLKAWGNDNLLVRFSVKVKEKRIAFIIGLIENTSLILHATTFDPDFQKFSPAKALIRTMAEWMAENKLTTLDFGDGDEKYKYFFANNEHFLNRIMISGKGNLAFILKSKLIRVIRNNNLVYNYYRNKIKILFKR